LAEFRQEKHHLHFEVVADGFLRHMIRIIIGILLEVGNGKLTPADVQAIHESGDSNMLLKMFSPHALCLLEVSHEPFVTPSCGGPA